MATPTISSVLKAVAVIEVLAEHGSLTAAQCAQITGFPRSSSYRILVTLREAGIVEGDEHGRFRLGLRLFELGGSVPERRRLADRARRPMEELCDQTGLQSNLAALSDGALVYLDNVHGRTSSTPVRAGQRGVLHASGVGKVLLAFAPAGVVASVLEAPLEECTPSTITEPERLASELEEIRERGFAVDRQEVVRKLSCLAMPVRNNRSRVVAAISLSGRTTTVEPALQALREELARTVRVIEGGMGWQPGLDDYLKRSGTPFPTISASHGETGT